MKNIITICLFGFLCGLIGCEPVEKSEDYSVIIRKPVEAEDKPRIPWKKEVAKRRSAGNKKQRFFNFVEEDDKVYQSLTPEVIVPTWLKHNETEVHYAKLRAKNEAKNNYSIGIMYHRNPAKGVFFYDQHVYASQKPGGDFYARIITPEHRGCKVCN